MSHIRDLFIIHRMLMDPLCLSPYWLWYELTCCPVCQSRISFALCVSTLISLRKLFAACHPSVNHSLSPPRSGRGGSRSKTAPGCLPAALYTVISSASFGGSRSRLLMTVLLFYQATAPGECHLSLVDLFTVPRDWNELQ